MAVKKEPRKGKGPTEEPPLTVADDRISSLPEEIIHNILSRFDSPKQVAFTSALSRRWLHLWRSYPVVEFRGEEFRHSAAGERIHRFAASAWMLWKRRSPLDALRLSLPGISRSDEGAVDRLIVSALLAGGGSPLEVAIRTRFSYPPPEGSLSNCNRTKVLQLTGCDLNGLGQSISLHCLQVLDLNLVKITEQLFNKFVGNAPNLESLSLDTCFGMERLEVCPSYFPKLKTLYIHTRSCRSCSGFELLLTKAPFLERLVLIEKNPCKLRTVSLSSAPNLKFVRISSYCRGEIPRPDLDDFINKVPSLQVLEINPIGLGNVPQKFHVISVAFLRTLWFKGFQTICKLNIESPFAAPILKELNLGLDGFTQSHLDDLLYKLPCLESLSLSLNNGSSWEMSKIKLRSDRLKKFQLFDWNRNKRDTLQELEIDAPNLVDVFYFGSMLRFPVKIVNVGSNCRFVVKGVEGHRITTQWFLEMRQSLSTLTSFHLNMGLDELDLSQQVSFDLGQVECSSSPLIVQSLQLGITTAASPNNQNDPLHLHTLSSKLYDIQNSATFLDGLFWACRPKLIFVTHDSDENRWFVEVMCKQLLNKDVANCCVGAKCWRHELICAKIENSIHDHMEISKNEISILTKNTGAKVFFMLTWC